MNKVVLIGFKKGSYKKGATEFTTRLEDHLDGVDDLGAKVKLLHELVDTYDSILINLTRDTKEIDMLELLFLEIAYTNKTPLYGFGQKNGNILERYIDRSFSDLLGIDYAISGVLLEKY